MAIRYKVTTLDRRSVVVYRTGLCKIYEKGKIVHKFPNTLGIMVFKTKKQAEMFNWWRSHSLILRVKSLGKGKKIKRVIHYSDLSPFLGNFDPERLAWMPAPEGTMGYDAVEVLD